MSDTAAAVMPTDIREENRKFVLSAFNNSTLLTIADVAERTGISNQTVKKCIDYYTKRNILVSCGKGSSSSVGGKRPVQYSLNGAVRFICILMHHSDLSVIVTDLFYNPIDRWNSGELHFQSLDAVLSHIREGLNAVANSLGRSPILGVCLSVPLIIDYNERLAFATAFPDWPKSDFGRSFSEELKAIIPTATKIIVTGDGRAAGCAMLKKNFEKYSKGDMITYYTSSGVGGTLIQNGDIGQEKKRLIDTIGHLIVNPDDKELCGCGGHGCLEKMVNRRRMKQRLTERVGAYTGSILHATPISEMTFAKLFDGSVRGDALCQSEVTYYAEMYAAAIRSILLTVQPSYIVFQGDFGNADDVFKRVLQRKIKEFRYLDILQNSFEIVYDNNALETEEATGTAYMLVQDFLENAEQYMSGTN